MKKALVALAASALFLGGCMSGPRYLNNAVWDHQAKAYEDAPLTTALVTDVIPVYPIVGFFGTAIDWIILNPVQFWGSDVWDGKGTSIAHDQPKAERTPWFK
jgi:hypothetical protein